MKCPMCNKNLPEDALFCDVCGSSVKEDEPKQEYVSEQQNQFSGNQYNGGRDTYGGNEGHGRAYEPPQLNNSKTPGWVIALISVLCVVVAFLIGIVAFMFAKGSDNGSADLKKTVETVSTDEIKNDDGDNQNDNTSDNNDNGNFDAADDINENDSYSTYRVKEDMSPQRDPQRAVGEVHVVEGYINPNPSSSGYFYPRGRRINRSELDDFYNANGSAMTQDIVRFMINELYAVNGYVFSTERYANYFAGKTWYYGNSTDQALVKNRMNSTDSANLDILYNYEKDHGWR